MNGAGARASNPPCTRTPVPRIQADGDLSHWLKVLDTTHAELLAAIGKVGNDPAAVAEYLKRGSDSEPPGTTQLPDGG